MSTVFYKGLVVDVLNSTSTASTTNDSLSEIRKNITSDAMKNFPRNTIIVKTISEGLAKRTNTKTLCYPFFSSHLSMPLKVGEYVWFVYENPETKGSIAYWLSRVCEPDHVEDVNFSFAARTYVQIPEKRAKRTSDKFEGEPADEGEQQTYSWQSPTSDPEEMIRLVEHAKQVHRFEAVPRYTKRSGDLVLQGSNNSLIMLGEERGQWAENAGMVASANTPEGGISAGHPAIDIVVGRGLKDPTESGNFRSVKGKKLTNEFGVEETDKREKSNVEGDAHFKVDATRVYLTANSDDVNSAFHPDFLLGVTYPNSRAGGEAPPPRSKGAFALIKSDNLRLIARDSGTIRIVKEPSFGNINGAAIMMKDDGELHMSGAKVYLSKYKTNGAKQPYVRHDALKNLLLSILSDIETFSTSLISHTTPGNGAPSLEIVNAATTLKASVASKAVSLDVWGTVGNDTFASTIIYGE